MPERWEPDRARGKSAQGRETLLVVNGAEQERALLRELFEWEYNVLEAENGAQALMLLEQYGGTLAAAVVDGATPGRDGCEFFDGAAARGLTERFPVVVLLDKDAGEEELRAFDQGATDVVRRPLEPRLVRRRVANAVESRRSRRRLEEQVEEQKENLRESNEAILDTLGSVIEYRSMETGQHILRIRMFIRILLRNVYRNCPQYGLDERKVALISSAAALHDIGKIAIPDAILKKPGPLTAEEFGVMKTHTTKGCEILAGLERLGEQAYQGYAYNICRYHHERWDGGGYPDGLRGDNIPICAQVAAVADVYDALTTDRVYKRAYPHEQAVNMILNGECGAFNPAVLECFKNVRDQFAALAREYADGRSPRGDALPLPAREDRVQDRGENVEQLARQKYFTLLKYQDTAVMEVDLDSGIFHMVYTPSRDFDLLRSGSTFEEAFRAFAAGSVHPEDRKRVGGTLDEYLARFFQDGLMKRSREYRVLHRGSGVYRWYRATLLRIDTEDPGRHKALIVWRDIDALKRSGEVQPMASACTEAMARNIPGGVQQCRNDSGYTMLHVNEGFTDLFGYTATELEARFDNRYREMILPADREAVRREVNRQLRQSNTVELEYRVACKDGTVLWILEKARLVTDERGEESFYCVLLDVTRSRQAQEELRLSLERHQIIMNQTNDIIFEWDIPSDTLTYSNNWDKKFGYTPISDRISQRIPKISHIYPEDHAVFCTIRKQMLGGVPYAETELRIARADGRYAWCRVRATAQFGEDGKPIKAVGVILDIDGEKRAAQKLRERAEQDALTKLCNKAAAFHRVEECLARRGEQQRCAMLVIDLDNFKQINDLYGHMFGDAVLTEIANELRQLFCSVDILSRIGGDEFLVFLQALEGPREAEERAQQVVNALQGMFRQSMHTCNLSCSIGISMAPEHGWGFQELFQRADRALYQAKSLGKDRYVVYSPEISAIPMEANTALTARIDSDEHPGAGDVGIVEYAFRILNESPDVEKAISTLLEIVGRQFNVSRTYIFENSPDGTYCCNTFEWCNKGIAPQKEYLQRVVYQEMAPDYQNNFNERGIFYCPDISALPKKHFEILAPQGIRSLLQCAIRDNGRFRGYVGFDECTGNRLWTREQIDVLTFLAELISTFLLKKRAQDEVEEAVRDLRMALDNQNAWIYVVDPDTYEMYYLNAKTRQIAPRARAGMCCHQAFFDRDSPCVACPARNIRKQINHTMEVYNPVLKVWSAADATLIRWGGRDACLLSCHDITPYKEPCGEN